MTSRELIPTQTGERQGTREASLCPPLLPSVPTADAQVPALMSLQLREEPQLPRTHSQAAHTAGQPRAEVTQGVAESLPRPL